MATPYNLVSADAQLALTEFSDAFAAALAMGDPGTWAKELGLLYSSNAIRTIYPLPVAAAGYKLRAGDDKMRDLYEKSLSIKPVEYQDGVQIKKRFLDAPDFSAAGWDRSPADIARETLRQPNKLVAALLNANATLEFDSKALFADDHPINVLDDSVTDVAGNTTFDNNFSSGAAASGVALVKNAMTYFRTLPGPNGAVMGLQLTDVLVPAALEGTFKEILESDLQYNATLAGASNTNIVSQNLYKGAVNMVVAPELLDSNVVYWIARGGPRPWIVQDGGTPEEIRYDESSDYYKDTGFVGVKYVLTMGAVGALPHGIAKQTIT